MITLAILGLGARGGEIYGNYLTAHSDDVKISAICDTNINQIKKYSEKFHVQKDMCFSNTDEFFSKGKIADGLLICTDDKSHYKLAMSAIKNGYDIILEKPIAVSEKECIEIKDYANICKKTVLVAHVLRYTEFYNQIKNIIIKGDIGDLVNINQTENIGYWHFAHSFVRGNWNSKVSSSPIILAKCSHDLDILNWLINKKCISVSSYGALNYYKKENKPQGAGKRCIYCFFKESCEYSAERIYIKERISGNNGWLTNYLCSSPTEKNIYEALRVGPYGVCVFDHENDVFDHQTCNLYYEEGVTANLTLSAFTQDCYRKIHVMGTKGEIIANDKDNILEINVFGKNSYKIDINSLTSDLSGHGGGDNRMLEDFIKYLNDKTHSLKSTISQSTESHIMAFKCDHSANNFGESIRI